MTAYGFNREHFFLDTVQMNAIQLNA
jgi:hypothetical protein